MRESDPRFAHLERRIGVFLLATALLVAGAVALVGVRQGLFTPKTTIVFHDESGRDIDEGMDVITRGLRIGRVRSVRFDEAGKVVVTLAIETRQMRAGSGAGLGRARGDQGLLRGLPHRDHARDSENRRTLDAAKAMAAGMPAAFGRLMIQSHWSLRDDFEVSSAALDTMVDCALEAGCYGARMTGAGFGGCCVALVDAPAAESFAGRVSNAYEARTGRRPVIYLCRPSAGASLETFAPGTVKSPSQLSPKGDA